ncbi:MAG: ABC transporter substrate-binding protein, partial [Anaerolineae bacterium]
MKDRIPNSAFIILLVVGIAAVLILRPDEDRSMQRIRDLGVLRVGVDPSFPPFESLDASGQIVGFDADLAAGLARRWGVRVQFESIGFDGLLDAIWAGRVDAIISALPLEPRYTKDIAYSQPYFEAGLRLVTITATPIAATTDLAGRKLAVELGSDADAEARRLRQRIPGLTLVTFATPAEALQALVD